MRALVVFESMFGDTKDVADAVARGLAEEMQVQTLEVGTAPGVVDPEIDVLIVGGPTHAFGMSRPGTREDAVKQSEGAGVLSGKLGIREWLATVQVSPQLQVAAFDTRVYKPHLPGLGRARRRAPVAPVGLHRFRARPELLRGRNQGSAGRRRAGSCVPLGQAAVRPRGPTRGCVLTATPRERPGRR